jgi:hypothetical protein
MRRVILTLIVSTAFLFSKDIALLVEAGSSFGLKGGKIDIKNMKEILGSKYKYYILKGDRATSVNIRKAFNKIARELNENDTFVFYYTGHGARFGNSQDSNEADKKDDFLVTTDMEMRRDRVKNVLIDDEINYLYSKIKAKKVIIIDACHSATMYKSISRNKFKVKAYKSEDILRRDFKKNPKWLDAKNRNFIHFAAARESESAIDTPKGSIFTKALKKVVQENGNISFSQLERLVQKEVHKTSSFNPNISRASDIDKDNLYTKDIFSIQTSRDSENRETLSEFLDRNKDKESIEVVTQSRNREFKSGEFIAVKGFLDREPKYIYLVEVEPNKREKVVSDKKTCIYYSRMDKYICQYSKLQIKGRGKSKIYIIESDRPLLNSSLKKDIVIKPKNRFLNRLKDSEFSFGSMEINVF